MLPFLKNKQEGGMSGDVVEQDEELSFIDAIASDMLSAVEKKDKDLLIAALESLCEYLKEEDKEQDKQLLEKDN